MKVSCKGHQHSGDTAVEKFFNAKDFDEMGIHAPHIIKKVLEDPLINYHI